MQKRRLEYSVYFALALILTGALAWLGLRERPKTSLAALDLGDGRILQIEGVTYGTSHRIGNPRSEFISRFRPWLPKKLFALLEPRYPQSAIEHLDRAALVVWVNAIDPATGLNVDCQQIRMEIVDQQGDIYTADTGSWFGGEHFWRVGHVFFTFPRTEATLTMQVTSWKSGRSGRVEIPNPFVAQPAAWQGEALPQTKRIGDIDLVLAGLNVRTNGGPNTRVWETRYVYWDPVWKLRQGNKDLPGWDESQWMAEDPTGNKSQHPGTHQPILRFTATFYPSPTNLQAAPLIATLPEVILTPRQAAVWWNRKIEFETKEISVLGFFPAGNYVFSEGVLLTNPPVSMGATSGGAPSGWTGQTVTVSPVKKVHYHGHYSTTNPIIYLRAAPLDAKHRLGVRLRDESGAYWMAEPEPQGGTDGIQPYLVHLPLGTKRFVVELVVLKPVEAEFTVKVPAVTDR